MKLAIDNVNFFRFFLLKSAMLSHLL